MKKSLLILLLMTIFVQSCNETNANEIQLKWHKSYPEDTFQRHITGLKWGLSYLGSTIPYNLEVIKANVKDSTVTLSVKELGLSDTASEKLLQLHKVFKTSEAYKKYGAFDLGRYVALTFGSPKHYYAIVDIPKNFDTYKRLYTLDTVKGYIDNSSVSKVDRIISFSQINQNKQVFISAEIDAISKDTLEYETMERMSNGQLKFGVYDADGNRKTGAERHVTEAGTPAKCIWCHEVVVQPLHRAQNNHLGHLSYKTFRDTLTYFNNQLQNYQDTLWLDEKLKNKRLHTELELVYISFMEPSAERIAREWQMPLKAVKKKLSGLETHTHEEFPFLGYLYHRKDIDALAPHQVIRVSESIREASNYEANLLENN